MAGDVVLTLRGLTPGFEVVREEISLYEECDLLEDVGHRTGGAQIEAGERGLSELEILSEVDDYPLEKVYEDAVLDGVKKKYIDVDDAGKHGCRIARLKKPGPGGEAVEDSCIKTWHGVGSGDGHDFERIWVAFYDRVESGAFERRLFLSREDKYSEGKVELVRAFADGRQLVAIEHRSGWGTGFRTTAYELVGWDEGEYMPVKRVYRATMLCDCSWDGKKEVEYTVIPTFNIPGEQKGMDPGLYSTELMLTYKFIGRYQGSSFTTAEYLGMEAIEGSQDEYTGTWRERWIWDEEKFEFVNRIDEDASGMPVEMRRTLIDLCEAG
jgi:hypothetical protein